MSRKVKSVYFNTSDPWEYEMYAYSQQYPNFSKFVKKLIQNHINGINPNQSVQQDEYINHSNETVDSPIFDTNLMKNLL
ncbi:hypothetical protein [Metabacillus sp. Hm71]|uniref:hypothetical protein n=1 Tax=Metabacillus sp. Hm71 TaxID=3450743 RepID=UPI003F436640